MPQGTSLRRTPHTWPASPLVMFSASGVARTSCARSSTRRSSFFLTETTLVAQVSIRDVLAKAPGWGWHPSPCGLNVCQDRRHRHIQSIMKLASCITGNTFALGRGNYRPLSAPTQTLLPWKPWRELRILNPPAQLGRFPISRFSHSPCRDFLHVTGIPFLGERR